MQWIFLHGQCRSNTHVVIFLDLQRQQRIMEEFQKSVETAERGARMAEDAGAPKMAAKFRAIARDFAKADKILEG